MKKTKNTDQLLAEQYRLQMEEMKLRTQLHSQWSTLKQEAAPGKIVQQLFSGCTSSSQEKSGSSNEFIKQAVATGAETILKNILSSTRKGITGLFRK